MKLAPVSAAPLNDNTYGHFTKGALFPDASINNMASSFASRLPRTKETRRVRVARTIAVSFLLSSLLFVSLRFFLFLSFSFLHQTRIVCRLSGSFSPHCLPFLLMRRVWRVPFMVPYKSVDLAPRDWLLHTHVFPTMIYEIYTQPD